MKEKSIYIGFFTYAGYNKLIIEATEEDCWKAMKKEYYKWRKGYEGHYTFKYATEYFGYSVEKATTGTMIDYN